MARHIACSLALIASFALSADTTLAIGPGIMMTGGGDGKSIEPDKPDTDKPETRPTMSTKDNTPKGTNGKDPNENQVGPPGPLGDGRDECFENAAMAAGGTAFVSIAAGQGWATPGLTLASGAGTYAVCKVVKGDKRVKCSVPEWRANTIQRTRRP